MYFLIDNRRYIEWVLCVIRYTSKKTFNDLVNVSRWNIFNRTASLFFSLRAEDVTPSVYYIICSVLTASALYLKLNYNNRFP